VDGLDRHQIANIALDEVGWGISTGSDVMTGVRQNHGSVSVVLEYNASVREKVSVLNGAPPDGSWRGDDMISKSWRIVVASLGPVTRQLVSSPTQLMGIQLLLKIQY
jgi:hypothetical protein